VDIYVTSIRIHMQGERGSALARERASGRERGRGSESGKERESTTWGEKRLRPMLARKSGLRKNRESRSTHSACTIPSRSMGSSWLSARISVTVGYYWLLQGQRPSAYQLGYHLRINLLLVTIRAASVTSGYYQGSALATCCSCGSATIASEGNGKICPVVTGSSLSPCSSLQHHPVR